MGARPRVVLYYPERGNPAHGQPYSADLLPLEFLQIAAPAREAGFDVDIVDSMLEEDPRETLVHLMRKLEGAFAFGSTCIVGYQVADGAVVAKAVREKFPSLPIIWGGWFPSVAPEMFLAQDLADAVCIGQGEITFREWLVALRDKTPVEDVAGLALWRDGKRRDTAKRAVVQLESLPEPDFGMIPVNRYLDIQERQARTAKVRYRFPDPPGFSSAEPYRAISFFSSFGCPEPCAFCCSPLVTGRRWVALGAKTTVDRLEKLRRTYDFDVVRFQDANFGVSPRRVKEFCRELIDRRLGIHWNATIEVETILKCDEETLDLMRESGCHMMWVGAETATREMQSYIRKGIEDGHTMAAMQRMAKRGIRIGLFWIIGFPEESEESMRATLDLAAQVKSRFPECTSDVLLFRPLPGTECGDHAQRVAPAIARSFEDWGRMIEYKRENATFDLLPPRIRRRYHRYTYLLHWCEGLVPGRTLFHRFLKGTARLRLSRQQYAFPLEFKLYDWSGRVLRALGLTRSAKLAPRAAGVALEGAFGEARAPEALTLSGPDL